MSHDNGPVDNGPVDNGRVPIAVANAPVSYGAFELTVGYDPNVPGRPLGQRQRGDREHPVTCGAGPYTMA